MKTLTPTLVAEIRQRSRSGTVTAAALATEYGVSRCAKRGARNPCKNSICRLFPVAARKARILAMDKSYMHFRAPA